MDKSIGSQLKKYLQIILLISTVSANYTGGYANAPFNLESCARDVALVGATVAGGTEGFYSFSNPALLPNMKSLKFSTSYSMLALDRYVQVVSISKNLPPSAGISLSIYRSGTDNVEGRSSTNFLTGKIYSTSNYFGMISFGVAPSKHFSIGINVKAFYSSIFLDSPFTDPNSNGVFMDIGALYTREKVRIGIKYENVGTSMKWKIDEGGHNQFSYNETIPKQISIGCNYLLSNKFQIFAQQDLLLIENQDFNYRNKLAIEYKRKEIQIRGGILVQNNSLTPRFGIGFDRKIFSANKVTFDYSLDFGKASEGLNNNLSIIISY